MRSIVLPSVACMPLPYYCTRWFKYDRDWFGLFAHKSVPVIFEPTCTLSHEGTIFGDKSRW